MRLSFEILLFVTLVVINNGQEIAFPAVEEQSPGEVPPRLTDNRIPIYIPNRCPPNQLLYPGDQKHDWVCDCGPGYIFYPKKDGCFLAYRKGPCDENQYLILPKDKVVPECSDNPCKTDGYVRYEDECYKLDSTGKPCKPYYESGEFFGVNTTTLKLECMTKAPDMLSQEPKYVPCKFRSLRP